MRIKRVVLTKTKLERLPVDDRAFYLLAGHMLNEICSLKKVLEWFVAPTSESDQCFVLRSGKAMSGLIYARILAGKLHEARNAIQRYWHGTGISQRIEPLLVDGSVEALRNIKRYFNNPNLISDVRNSHGFHYSIEGYMDIWEEISEGPNFEILLGGTTLNNLHLASELVANGSMLLTIGRTNQLDQLAAIFDDCKNVSTWFLDFFEGVLLVMTEEMYDEPLSTIGIYEEIDPRHYYDEISLDYFYKIR